MPPLYPLINYFGGEIFSWVADKAFDQIISAIVGAIALIFYVVKILLVFILGMTNWALGFILNLNFEILNPQNFTYQFISAGWTFGRDIANLGFVLFIILIALGTIIRFKSYEAKTLLPKLIAAAILVNFSLAIPSIFLNFSNILTNSFLSKIGDPKEGLTGSFQLASQFMNVLSPQNSNSPLFSSEDVANLIGNNAGVGPKIVAHVGFLAQLSANNFILVISILVVGALVVLLLVRYITLHFLLILAPLAWLTSVIPGVESTYKSWWTKFIQQVFFLPLTIFLIALVLLIGKGWTDVLGSSAMDNLGIVDAFSKTLQNTMRFGVITIVASGFLLGAILVGQRLSIAGADKAMGTIKNWGQATRKWATKKTGDALVGNRATQAVAKRLITLGKDSNSSLVKIATNPLRKLGVITQNKSDKIEKEKVEKAKKTYITGDSVKDVDRLGISKRADIEQAKTTAEDKNKITKEIKDAKEDAKQKEEAKKEAQKKYEEAERRVETTRKKESENIEKLKMLREKETDEAKQLEYDEKISGAERRINDAEDNKERREEAMGNAKEAHEKAVKKLKDVMEKEEDFNKNILNKMPANIRDALENANYEISNVKWQSGFNPFKSLAQKIESEYNLPTLAKILGKEIEPAKTMKGVYPETNNEKLESAKKAYTQLKQNLETRKAKIQKDPLASQKEVDDIESQIREVDIRIKRIDTHTNKIQERNKKLEKLKEKAKDKLENTDISGIFEGTRRNFITWRPRRENKRIETLKMNSPEKRTEKSRKKQREEEEKK